MFFCQDSIPNLPVILLSKQFKEGKKKRFLFALASMLNIVDESMASFLYTVMSFYHKRAGKTIDASCYQAVIN